MNAMLKWFSALLCRRVYKRHEWSRAYRIKDTDAYIKYCNRCEAIAPVKRRAKKEAK